MVRRRIQKIRSELDGVRRRRSLHMGRRKKSTIPMATLVGYTNAGKSTLFNALSNAGVTAEDKLFSTLDPVTRCIRLPSGSQLLLSDTVGFIQKLSPKVVAAFRATLEELQQSDILLHVIDVSHPKAPEQTSVVEDTLSELGLGERPRLLVMNKMDLLANTNGSAAPGTVSPESARNGTWPSVLVSAAKNWNLGALLHEIEKRMMAIEGPMMAPVR